MKSKALLYYIFIALLALVSSCTGTRHLADDQYLMRQGKIKIQDKNKTENFSELKTELNKLAKLNDNVKFLWMRPNLSIHNMVKQPEEDQKFKNWLKYKLGKPPLLYNKPALDRIALALDNQLFNYGYFNASIQYELIQKKKQIKPVFLINTSKPYLIDSIYYQSAGISIDEKCEMAFQNSLLEKGMPYQLEMLIEERSRISTQITNQGYYYFRPDHLEFIADTNFSKRSVDILLRLKPDNPPEAYEPYYFGNILLEDNFVLGQKTSMDTIDIQGLTYVSPRAYIKPKVVANTVHLKRGELYSKQDHLRTLTHIRALNVYQFVNIIYEKDDSLNGILNTRLVLVPLKKMSLNGEVNANFKSNNYAGPGVLLTFLNRNTFKGAELLHVSFGGRFEAQLGEEIGNNFLYEFKLDGSLDLPRLYPFKSRRVNRSYMPKTSLKLGAGIQERVEYFQMLTTNITVQYHWKVSDRLQHKYSPIEVTSARLLKTTDDFRDFLIENPSVRRSFEEQFILGTNYEVVLNSKAEKRSPFFLGLSLDLSGNLASGVFMLMGNPEPDEENPNKIFNTPYSQYIRFRFDFRHNLHLPHSQNLAFRAIAGIGVPYGNSRIMPYIKQYFVGGANSLRGFAARSIGPGSYQPHEETGSKVMVDQAGDIKLESNLEYRFPVFGVFKGALFSDFGNIWLVNEDKSREGSQFKTDTFFREFAVSGGLGLRIDFSPLLIRFDFGWPIRYPYEHPDNGNYWQLEELFSKNGQWRRKNVILNISLGYPF